VLSKKPTSRALDLGTLVHAHLLGGKQEFVVKQYSDYRSKEAREWRDAQTLPIIDESEFETTGFIFFVHKILCFTPIG
jgi:hypothetical protein